jgi:hypothetical protein
MLIVMVAEAGGGGQCVVVCGSELWNVEFHFVKFVVVGCGVTFTHSQHIALRRLESVAQCARLSAP